MRWLVILACLAVLLFAWGRISRSTAGDASAPSAPVSAHPLPPAWDGIFFVTDSRDYDSSLVDLLREEGRRVEVVSSSDRHRLAESAAGAVFVDTEAKRYWSGLPKDSLARLFEHQKVFGIGDGGADLFRALDLAIGSCMSSYDGTLVVEGEDVLGIAVPRGPDGKGSLALYAGPARLHRGVYDEGNPKLAGFQGLARWRDAPNHWPLARQGNYLLWGITAKSRDWTPEGKRFFRELLARHLGEASVPLSRAVKPVELVQPGTSTGRITRNRQRGEVRFRARKPGSLKAKVVWPAEKGECALILHGPDFARVDGPSPLVIRFEVTAAHLRDEREWRLEFTQFGEMHKEGVPYTLELDFP